MFAQANVTTTNGTGLQDRINSGRNGTASVGPASCEAAVIPRVSTLISYKEGVDGFHNFPKRWWSPWLEVAGGEHALLL